jgi:hypothetical protein
MRGVTSTNRHLILLIVAGCGASQAQPASEVQPLPALRSSAPAATETTTDGCVAIIPGTDVCDSPRNHAVIDFCERYRHALEARDADALLALASPRYNDQVDYAGLKAKMKSLMQSVSSIRYEIRYKNVTFRDDGTVAVDLTYASSYEMLGQWHHSVTDNELVLEQNGSSFQILRGM